MINRCSQTLLLLGILFLSACCNKPERETSSLLVKHIDVVTSDGTQKLTNSKIDIKYNSDNQISSYDEHFVRYYEEGHTSEQTFAYTFNYSDNQCQVLRTIEGAEPEVETYYFNEDNTLSRIDGKDGTVSTFSYQDGYLIEWNDRKMTWEEGNIVSVTKGAGTEYGFSYSDIDNPFKDTVDWTIDVGTILPGDPFGYGFAGKRNSKLLNTVSGRNGTTYPEYHWSYTIDKSTGRVLGYEKNVIIDGETPLRITNVKFGY